MHFEPTHLYHIYNQGNNRQKIFFNRENYLFFLRKIRTHVLPFCDILAYCLMPNHFHFLVKVNFVEAPVSPTSTQGLTQSLKQPIHRVTLSHPVNKSTNLNQSIAILLRSYTRAINNQEKTSGSLFRQKTKSACLSCPETVIPDYMKYHSRLLKSGVFKYDNAKEYPTVCFNYIHENPVTAEIVEKAVDWEFSSARDYAGLRNGTLVNIQIAQKYISTIIV